MGREHSVTIEARSTGWSPGEEKVAIDVLQKIACCEDAGKGLPIAVFEAFVAAKKNISTEVVVFNERGGIYLIQRKSREESPTEPYPNQWHTPGVTHQKNETHEGAFARLVKREFGEMPILRRSFVDDREGADPPRGPYILRIFAVELAAAPKNPRGRWFSVDDIPWEELVPGHRNTIIPLALAHHKLARLMEGSLCR